MLWKKQHPTTALVVTVSCLCFVIYHLLSMFGHDLASPFVAASSSTSGLVVVSPVGGDHPSRSATPFPSRSDTRTVPASDAYDVVHVRHLREQYPGEFGWVFKRYISSGLEVEFMEAVKPFARAMSFAPLIERFRNASVAYVQTPNRFVPDMPPTRPKEFAAECRRYAASARRSGDVARDVSQSTCLGLTDPLDTYIFSRFEYEFVCLAPPCDPTTLPAGRREGDVHTSFIEPLFGYLRHPRNFYRNGYSKTFVANREYMIVDKWALNHLYTRWKWDRLPRRAFFYDLGASTYTTGIGGSSQQWFADMSDCLCVPTTDIHMWEATKQVPRHIWNPVPTHLLPSYHYFNFPLLSDPKSIRNPLNHLRQQVRPDGSQPVFVKVDFDSRVIEMDIVNQLVSDASIHGLVDEFFFEHHVVLGRMAIHWGKSVDPQSNISTSIDLFLRMRRLGIRAHSWV